MNAARYRKALIVNADDFGLSEGVNRGVIKAYEHGIVTSASLMVRWSAAADAAAYARAHPRLSVGLHVDLCEWVFSGEEWRPAYEVVPVDNPVAVAGEIERQLHAFRSLLGRDPSHLDSHQHVHRSEPIRSILLGHARTLGIALRSFDPRVTYCGSFYGQSDKGYPCPEGISVQGLLGVLRSLPDGITELGCHPGAETDVPSTYRAERAVECETLCDPRIRAALEQGQIALCSFADLPSESAYCPVSTTR